MTLACVPMVAFFAVVSLKFVSTAIQIAMRLSNLEILTHNKLFATSLLLKHENSLREHRPLFRGYVVSIGDLNLLLRQYRLHPL
jgi:hypothetical protein